MTDSAHYQANAAKQAVARYENAILGWPVLASGFDSETEAKTFAAYLRDRAVPAGYIYAPAETQSEVSVLLGLTHRPHQVRVMHEDAQDAWCLYEQGVGRTNVITGETYPSRWSR